MKWNAVEDEWQYFSIPGDKNSVYEILNIPLSVRGFQQIMVLDYSSQQIKAKLRGDIFYPSQASLHLREIILEYFWNILKIILNKSYLYWVMVVENLGWTRYYHRNKKIN